MQIPGFGLVPIGLVSCHSRFWLDSSANILLSVSKISFLTVQNVVFMRVS